MRNAAQSKLNAKHKTHGRKKIKKEHELVTMVRKLIHLVTKVLVPTPIYPLPSPRNRVQREKLDVIKILTLNFDFIYSKDFLYDSTSSRKRLKDKNVAMA